MLKAHLSSRVKNEGRTRGMDAERGPLEHGCESGRSVSEMMNRGPPTQWASDTCVGAGLLRVCAHTPLTG